MALADFLVGVRPESPLDGETYRFLVAVHSNQVALTDFTVAVHVQRALTDFRVHVRSLPNTQTPFAATIQRPVGRVVQA